MPKRGPEGPRQPGKTKFRRPDHLRLVDETYVPGQLRPTKGPSKSPASRDKKAYSRSMSDKKTPEAGIENHPYLIATTKAIRERANRRALAIIATIGGIMGSGIYIYGKAVGFNSGPRALMTNSPGLQDLEDLPDPEILHLMCLREALHDEITKASWANGWATDNCDMDEIDGLKRIDYYNPEMAANTVRTRIQAAKNFALKKSGYDQMAIQWIARDDKLHEIVNPEARIADHKSNELESRQQEVKLKAMNKKRSRND